MTMAIESLPTDSPMIDEDAKTIYSRSSALDIKTPARELLERYSNIPPKEVDAHVINIVCFPDITGCLGKNANNEVRGIAAFTFGHIPALDICVSYP